MDANRFDRMVKAISVAGTRRGVLHLLTGLSIGGVLALFADQKADAAGRRKRRKKRHKHGKGRHKGKHQEKKCQPKSKATTCAGKCGSVKNNCQKTVDCGSCACDPPCPACQICDESTQSCIADASQEGEPCGAAASCQGGELTPPGACDGSGTCQPGTPVSCAPYAHCDGNACATSCADHDDCATDALCLSDGTCQACDVTCTGTPAECGAALQAAMDGGGTIYVCPGTYREGFVLTQAVTVIGAGEGSDAARNTILDGNNAVRVMQIAEGTGTVELQGLRVTGGLLATDEDDGLGAGIFHQGTTLRMRDCTVTGNEVGADFASYGGGIYGDVDRTLELTRCTVSQNIAIGTRIDFVGGADGGGIVTQGTTTLTDCVIADNDAYYDGGGILQLGGLTTLAGSTVVRGNGSDHGGGIYVSGGTLVIEETCRVTANTIPTFLGGGGGIYNAGGTVTLQGADPTPIVVNNCWNNCDGPVPVPKCAATPISC